jgi:hypothetical protein
MTLDPKNVAARLGAEHVSQMPDVGGGAFGMARLAAALKERLEPAQGRRPGQPTNIRWVLVPKVPMSRETENQLILLADQMSTPERRVSPMQLAAQLLEETLQKKGENILPPPLEDDRK